MPLSTPTENEETKKSDESQLSALSIIMAAPSNIILGLMVFNQIASTYSENAKLYREDNITLGMVFLWTIPLLIIGAIVALKTGKRKRLCLLVNLAPIAIPLAIAIVA